MTLKILIVDDEQSLRLSLREILEHAHYQVFESACGREGLDRARAILPDAVLLDMGLPDMEGLTVLRKLREWAKFPILIVSVQDSESLIVRALDLGADDYLTKPYSEHELLARLRAALRRAERDPGHPVLRFEGLRIDLPREEASVDGRSVKLTATEWEVLRCLLRDPGKLITVEKIMRSVWSEATSDNLASLRVYVGHLREKFAPYGPRFIVNEPGIGYRVLTGDETDG